MGIIVSLVAEAIGVAVGAIEAAAATAAECLGSVVAETAGEANDIGMSLLDGEEDTMFDRGGGEQETYVDSGMVNDSWNWEPTDATDTGRSSFATTGAVGGGAVAAVVVSTAIGLAVALQRDDEVKAVVDQGVEYANATLSVYQQNGMVPDNSGMVVPDDVLAFMTQSEWEESFDALLEDRLTGRPIPTFTEDVTAIASSRVRHLPFSLFADAQPAFNTRSSARRAADAADVVRRGVEHGRQLQNAINAYRAMMQARGAVAGALEAVDAAPEIVEAAQVAYNTGRLAYAAAVAALGVTGGVIGASSKYTRDTIMSLLDSWTKVPEKQLPYISEDAVPMDPIRYAEAPEGVTYEGRQWHKNRHDFFTGEDGRLGMHRVAWWEPQDNYHRGGLDPWFQLPPRTPDQLVNLNLYLGSVHDSNMNTDQLSLSGMIIVGNVVLNVADKTKKKRKKDNAGNKRRSRGPEPGSRPKRKR